jgi:putative FmdB family regulatory protein
MPTYDLKCNECGERFERFLKRFLSDEDRVCPHCGSRDVRTGVGGGVLGVGTAPSKAPSCGTTRFG